MNKKALWAAACLMAIMAFATLFLNSVRLTGTYADQLDAANIPANVSIYDTLNFERKDVENWLSAVTSDMRAPIRSGINSLAAIVHDAPNALRDKGLSVGEIRLLLSETNNVLGNMKTMLAKIEKVERFYGFNNVGEIFDYLYDYASLNRYVKLDDYKEITGNLTEITSDLAIHVNRYSWTVNVLSILTVAALIFAIACYFKRGRFLGVPMACVMVIWLTITVIVVNKANEGFGALTGLLGMPIEETGRLLVLMPWPIVGLILAVGSAVAGYTAGKKPR